MFVSVHAGSGPAHIGLDWALRQKVPIPPHLHQLWILLFLPQPEREGEEEGVERKCGVILRSIPSTFSIQGEGGAEADLSQSKEEGQHLEGCLLCWEVLSQHCLHGLWVGILSHRMHLI